jgi:hypothetical protein
MKIDLKPNELVIRSSDIKTIDGKELKLILTSQKRIYFIENELIVNEIQSSDIVDIMYFDKNLFNKNGVNIITDNIEYKFTIKNRYKWEKSFSSLY